MKRSIKDILLLVILLIYMIIYKLFIFNNFMEYSLMISASFMILLIVFSVILLGYRKDKITNMKLSILKLVGLFLAFAFLIMYGAGFFTGFLRNAYSLKFPTIIDNLIAPFVLIIATEIFRYVVVSANKDKKNFLVLLTIFLIVFELVMNFRTLNFSCFREIFYTLTRDILPIVIKNGVLSYLCYKVGCRIPILYRCVTELYVFLVPLIPDLGEYIGVMISIILPALIYICSFSIIEEYENGVEHVFVKDGFRWFDIPIYVVIIVFICLISGYFPHTLMGIGSNSMEPEIAKGDAIIMEKLKDKNELKKGKIIAYKNDGMIIVHRLVDIKEENGKVLYITKGDANNDVDNIDLKYSDIVGVVKVKIPFIGYPAVWLSRLFN